MSDNNDSLLANNWQMFLSGIIVGVLSKRELLDVISLKNDPGQPPRIIAETSAGETLSITVVVKEIKEEEEPE